MPSELDPRWAEQLADGLSAEAEGVGAAVVGGDMAGSQVITIAVTALGEINGPAPVLRSGASPGDIVAMAGRIGPAGAARPRCWSRPTGGRSCRTGPVRPAPSSGRPR